MKSKLDFLILYFQNMLKKYSLTFQLGNISN